VNLQVDLLAGTQGHRGNLRGPPNGQKVILAG
jgi:hypothetical protein